MTSRAARKRLEDPDDHFPYKLDEALALDLDAPAGPFGPEDRSRTVGDYFSQEIARASAAYVDAQEGYLLDPSDDTKVRYEAARDELVMTRREHRRNRPGAQATVEG